MPDWTPETWLIAAGRTRVAGDPLNVPPVFASNFFLPHERIYSRSEGTATTDALEELLGGLEGGRALAFGSGMAAVAAVFHRLPVGSRIAVPEDPYHGVAGIVAEGEAQGRWTVDRLDQADTATWIDALQVCDLVWLESPENPLITVADLPAICGAPRPATTLVGVDSTFATPLTQQPLDYGADVVMHSATKFIGGHSDLLAGALMVRRDDLYDEFHQRRLLYGATIGAMEAFLTIRGARTLGLRMDKAQANAMELAQRLESHPAITRVRYPGLPSHDTHEAAKRFMTGFGAMLSFETDGDAARCDVMLGRLELVNHATSLGGVETTVERRASIPGQERIPPTLVRMSVGCEHVDDLWSDLTNALT
ncbi:MAG: PLP-dependent transferase [Ilumatobacteraceae bacterium]|nr:PLP-dependent transferase [Ilumatobacteraceae bacterium]